MKSLIILVLISLLLLGCSKDNEDKSMSKWRVSEWCVPKVSGIVGCQTPTENIKSFFNKDLDGVVPGTVKLYHEDADVKQYRRFIEKIN